MFRLFWSLLASVRVIARTTEKLPAQLSIDALVRS